MHPDQPQKYSSQIFTILIITIFFIPTFFIPVSFISVQYGTSLLFAFGVVISALLYVVGVLQSGSISLPNPGKKTLLVLFIVPILYVLAGVANGFSRLTFFGYTFDINTVGFILLAFVFLFLTSITFRNSQRIFYSHFTFIVSVLVTSIFIILRIIFDVNFLSFGVFTNLTSTVIGNWNNLGILFGASAILSILSLELAHLGKFMKVFLFISLIISIAFLAIVNFSVIWIILSICFFLFIMFKIFSYDGNESSFLGWIKKIPPLSLIVFLASILFVIWGSSIGGFFSNWFKLSNIEIRPSFSATMDIARNTLNNNPLLGSGPNTFINGWLAWRPDDVLSTVFWNLDFTNGIGLLPTYLVTTGLMGALAWVIFLGFYIYIGIKSIFSENGDDFSRYLLVSSFFTSLFLWIMAIVYIPSTVIYILTFFFTGLFFASVYNCGVISVETKFFTSNPKVGFLSSLILVSLFIACLALAYGLFINSKSLWFFQKSSYALNVEKNHDLSETYILKAINLVPYDVYYRALSEIELVKLSVIANEDTKKIKPEVVQKQFSEVLSNAIKAGISAKDADSANYLNWISLARVYEAVSSPDLSIKGSYDGATLAYKEAQRRNPKNPAIPVLLSRLAASQNDLIRARDYAIEAIQIKNNYLDAYFVLSQIEVASGNLRGAIDAVTASSVIDPTNPALYFQLGLLKYNLSDWSGAAAAFEKATSIVKDYANAKYFLGLSYERLGQHEKAIKEFQDLAKTNPESVEVKVILSNLIDNKPIFVSNEVNKPEKGKNLPVKEKQ